jgi:hypothetical protein
LTSTNKPLRQAVNPEMEENPALRDGKAGFLLSGVLEYWSIGK